jgi:uncharacterized membrane protein YcfT
MPQTSIDADASHVAWVDYAKGVCILLVVMMHSTLGVGEAFGGVGFMHTIVDFVQPFRIPAFFLTAALFLARSIDKPWPEYIDKKVLHFAYFYLLWLAINCVVKFAGGGPSPVVQNMLDGLVEPFGTLWFIYVLPLMFLAARATKRAPIFMFVGAALLQILSPRTGWYAADQFAHYFVFFVTGYLFATNVFRLADWATRRPLPALAALVVWFSASLALWLIPIGGGRLISAPGVSLLAGLAGAAAICIASALLARANVLGFLRYAGERTLPIYLAFFLPMAATRILLLKLAPGMDIGLASLIVWIIAVIAPLILHRLVLPTPLRVLFARPGLFKRERIPTPA